jgi:23S rRNA (adenine2503-C2)-methyltransferase
MHLKKIYKIIMPIILKNQTSDELYSLLAKHGVTLRLARRLQGALFKTGTLPAAMTETSDTLLKAIKDVCTIPHLITGKKLISEKDNFAKYLFRSDDGSCFEAVRIPVFTNPDQPKYIVCVSSQAGCALGCAFCATGTMGFVRNLQPWEIVDQVVKIQNDSEHPVKGVVFMGMGEPLLNYNAVITAAKIISEPCGMAISGKAISISTSGIIPGIRKFIDEQHPYRLILSVTSADSKTRAGLMPVENTYPLEKIIPLLKEYHAKTGQRITLAWMMIAGVNTSENDAMQCATLVKDIPVKIDLIDVNDERKIYLPPDDNERNRFMDFLRIHLAMPVARRYSGGQDIKAACGMLAGK